MRAIITAKYEVSLEDEDVADIESGVMATKEFDWLWYTKSFNRAWCDSVEVPELGKRIERAKEVMLDE